MKTAPILLDLFCGAGGISHGFHQAGFDVVAGVDFDADSIVTFRLNHPNAIGVVADLTDARPEDLAAAIGVGPGEVDCLAGGPPCQGFSRNRAFRHKDGAFVDDPRNHLYWHFFDYVRYFRPRIVVMENVPEILIKANGAFQEAVLDQFHGLGYDVTARVLNAAHYGVPQHRRRAFFLAGSDRQRVTIPEPTTQLGPRPGRRTPTSADYVGRRRDEGTLPLFETAMPTGPTVWEAIGDLYGRYSTALNDTTTYSASPATDYQQAMRGDCLRVHNHFRWPLSERQLKRIRLLTEGQGMLHLPDELRTEDGYGSAYRRMQKDAQALTITTWMFHPGSGMFTHPIEDRVVTIREAARLQSFGDRFAFIGKYHSQCRQVGNAVAPLVGSAIAQTVLPILGYRSAQPPVTRSVAP